MVLKVIVGLGNPEPRFDNTRHNAGFTLINRIAIKYGAAFQKKQNLFCEISKVSLPDNDLLLVKPVTYMNHSGQAVQEVLNWYKITPGNLLVVHDDVSLPLGTIRFQRAGSAGGQHGVESIIELLGKDKLFNRLKLGVGPDPGGAARAQYVLSPFPDCDIPLYTLVIQESVKAVQIWFEEGINEAMNKFNGLDLRHI